LFCFTVYQPVLLSSKAKKPQQTMAESNWWPFRDRQINELLNLEDSEVPESSEWEEIACQADLDILHETNVAIDEQHEVYIYHH
jgi:hypothetical protein